MLWTDEAIEALKSMALQGRSARAIAEALGAPSRSAVIGKANRIGVKLNGGSTGGERGFPPADGAPRPPRRPRGAAGSGRSVVSILPRELRKPIWIFAGAEVGDMLRVGFEDIAESNCRWPLGDPLAEDFVYCGLPPARGRSYCAGHCRLAYQAPKGARESGGARPMSALAGAIPERSAAILPFLPQGQGRGAQVEIYPDAPPEIAPGIAGLG
jgi:GcrA cell cycle regulator